MGGSKSDRRPTQLKIKRNSEIKKKLKKIVCDDGIDTFDVAANVRVPVKADLKQVAHTHANE